MAKKNKSKPKALFKLTKLRIKFLKILFQILKVLKDLYLLT